MIIGPDGQPLGYLPATGSDDERSECVGRRPRRAAGEGHAHRQHDQAAARGGALRAARRGLAHPLARHPPPLDRRARAGARTELVDELERLSLPFTDDRVPSDAELRIAQAQLVGWLEGLFHGIQTALFAQQMAAQAQFEQMRRRAISGPGGGDTGQPGTQAPHEGGNGLYL